LNRIKELRAESHMTQVRLAIELEVSQETISAYEKEKHYPSFSQLVRLSKLFHASIDYIMGLSDVRNPSSPVINADLQKLISRCMHLDRRQVELVTAYIQGLVDGAKQTNLPT